MSAANKDKVVRGTQHLGTSQLPHDFKQRLQRFNHLHSTRISAHDKHTACLLHWLSTDPGEFNGTGELRATRPSLLERFGVFNTWLSKSPRNDRKGSLGVDMVSVDITPNLSVSFDNAAARRAY